MVWYLLDIFSVRPIGTSRSTEEDHGNRTEVMEVGCQKRTDHFSAEPIHNGRSSKPKTHEERNDSSSRFDSEYDVVCHWVVVGQNPLNKLARLDPQGLGPNQVTVRRDTALPVLELRNESVIFGPHHFGQLALGQTALLSQLAQPMSSFIT